MFTGVPDQTFHDLFNQMLINWDNPPGTISPPMRRAWKLCGTPTSAILPIIKQINDGNGTTRMSTILSPLAKKSFSTRASSPQPTWHQWAHLVTFRWILDPTTWPLAQNNLHSLPTWLWGNVSRSQATEEDFDSAKKSYYHSLQKLDNANCDNATPKPISTWQTTSQLTLKLFSNKWHKLLLAVNNCPPFPAPIPAMYQPTSPAYGFATTQTRMSPKAPPPPQYNQKYQNYGQHYGYGGVQSLGCGSGHGCHRGWGKSYQNSGYNSNSGPGGYNTPGTGGSWVGVSTIRKLTQTELNTTNTGIIAGAMDLMFLIGTSLQAALNCDQDMCQMHH